MNPKTEKASRHLRLVRPRTLTVLGWWGVIFFTLIPLSAPKAWGSVNSLLRKAYTVYFQGKYAEAKGLYLQACQQDPLNSMAFCGAALCEYQLNDLPTAESHLQKALTLNPAFEEAKVLSGMVHQRLTERQVRDLRFTLLMMEGVMYFRMHKYGQAQSALEKAAALNPDSADLHFNLGLTYLKLQQWDKSREEFEKCLKLKPDDRRAEYALGVLYEKIGAMGEAQNYFLGVAQAPNAGFYNLEAMRRLSTLHSDISYSPFHFSLRLQGGGGQSTLDQPPDSTAPVFTSSGANQYGHLQLSYSPLWGKTIVNFSYGGDGAWSEAPGQPPSFFNLHDFSVGSQFPLLSNWTLPISYDEQIGFNSSGDLNYQHHQASVAFQWLFKGSDSLQFQAQYLREIFPPPVGYDANNWIGTVSCSLVFPGSHYFNLAYSFRQSLADSAAADFYSYDLNSGSLTYHVEFGRGWNLTLNGGVQRQDYSPYPILDSNGNPRSDWIQNASAEFTIPVTGHWNFVLGDQYQKLQSNIPGYSQHSDNYYAGTQIFF